MSLRLPDRFEVLERLGAGAMGVVYRVYDRQRAAQVALKTLANVDAEGIYRFKQEFRVLADVAHPNLVVLYELLSEGGQWFFTMELVDGGDFLTYVRPEGGASADARGVGCDLARLRAALPQLANGIQALHEAGHLHRDVRPSNVLMTRDGRVVLVDFGLATMLATPSLDGSTVARIVGTPAYMSPEQAAGLPLVEATDWYSVGVMLYEALTRRLPFVDARSASFEETLPLGADDARGDDERPSRPGWLEVLLAKQQSDPPPPRDLVAEVPEDLDDLCMALLRRRPEERPPANEILRRLRGADVGPAARAAGRAAAIEGVPFIGREDHLARLRDAFRAVGMGSGVSVYVSGRSGIGKSALVRRFLEEVNGRRDAVVLEGRCYERESVAYKALDSVVDALSRHLVSLPRVQAAELLPRNAAALARVFPVLGRVEAVAAAPERGAAIPDPQELRQRAFGALRELLSRLADRHPVVVFIDDVQWGDLDSAGFLVDLLRPPEAPALLLILAYRSEDAATSPLLRALLAARREMPSAIDARDLAVEALAPNEACEVARALFADDDAASAAQAAAIAEESGGSPFLVQELVRYVQAGPSTPDRLAHNRVRLEDVLLMRLINLPDSARRLLEVVALAGRPVSRDVAARAAQVETDEPAALATLLSGHLVRTRQVLGGEELETYHDRIRETAVQQLPPAALAGCHQRLAVVLEASGRADAEELAVHFAGAGRSDEAATYAVRAAGQAAQALAFDRSARLYRMALDLRPPAGEERHALLVRLGDALANSGRGADAAKVYLEGSADAAHADALTLRLRAAEQLLITGHMDDGLAAMRTVLGAVGMTMASTPSRALLSILLNRVRFRLRGLRYRERDETEIPKRELIRIDVCRAVAVGLSMFDTIQAADFQTRALLLALRAGERYRLMQAFSIAGGIVATEGGAARQRAARLVEAMRALAARMDRPEAEALTILTEGSSAYLVGEWTRALDLCTRAEEILRDRCTGVAWELSTARRFALGALMYLGRFADLGRRAASLLATALDRGNLYLATDLRTRLTHLIRLAADDPDGGRREVLDAIAQWSRRGFHVQHYSTLLALAQIDLYEGKAREAWERTTGQWRVLLRSQLRRVQVIRIETHYLRGRTALAAAAQGFDRDRLLRVAARDAAVIARERMPWADPLALLLRAGLAAARRDETGAVEALRAAASGFEAADEALYAAVARRRLGQLLGGDEGRDLIACTDAWMTDQNIQQPARVANVFATGFAHVR